MCPVLLLLSARAFFFFTDKSSRTPLDNLTNSLRIPTIKWSGASRRLFVHDGFQLTQILYNGFLALYG